MRLKFPDIADPPNVIADAVGVLVMPGQFAAADFLTERNRFQDRAIAKAATAHVVNFPTRGLSMKAANVSTKSKL